MLESRRFSQLHVFSAYHFVMNDVERQRYPNERYSHVSLCTQYIQYAAYPDELAAKVKARFH
jgi:hypothetical protein